MPGNELKTIEEVFAAIAEAIGGEEAPAAAGRVVARLFPQGGFALRAGWMAVSRCEHGNIHFFMRRFGDDGCIAAGVMDREDALDFVEAINDEIEATLFQQSPSPGESGERLPS